MKNFNQGILLLKFFAAILITYSHMKILFPKYDGLVTGGAMGDGLFFFCSGFTLFLGRNDSFINWYKRRVFRIYPTVIMWALMSALFFGWSWSILDVVTTPRYWFIPCIMIYYLLFYLIRKFALNKLLLTFVISFVVTLSAYFLILDQSVSIMYANIPFMRIYYFLFMLLGATVALQHLKVVSVVRSFLYMTVSIVLYYVMMGIFKLDPFYCNFQILSIFPLISFVYWLFVFLSNHAILKVLDIPYLGRFIEVVSSLTLEIYLVQYAIFTDKLNFLFPANILLIFLIIVFFAYVLRCLSNFFIQIFSNEPFQVNDIYQIKKSR